MNMMSMSASNKRAVVIGGGAAGMMAAGCAAEHGAAVTLLEPNDRLGKKLLITGKGRCNVTNDCPWEDVLKNTPTNPRFLYSALSRFSPADAKAFFEAHGCALKTERGNRVFPVSDRSSDVQAALERYLRQTGVQVRHTRAMEIAVQDGAVCGVSTAFSQKISGESVHGSLSKASTPAPPRWPLSSAALSACVSAICPRAMLRNTLPGFMRANSAAPNM